MKTLILSLLFISFATAGFAQTKTETLKVAGECGTCKKKIETAAKKAGASYAVWNAESKDLVIKYNSSSSNTAKIEKAIAAAGYDTPDFKASDEAYNKLDDCCQYERTSATASEAKSCCDDKKCTEANCMKDGKCAKDMSCCKDSGCDKKDCCKQ
jgi:hypothetical protein